MTGSPRNLDIAWFLHVITEVLCSSHGLISVKKVSE